ncbi:MAG: DUF2808 domain-containing protein [Desertifilum sp.]|nr:DUF2808 domain-containing protein [Desertifilum sp.]MDI9640171.1 DUF2808 domain-containing protein [Geitlerinema splendidum]
MNLITRIGLTLAALASMGIHAQFAKAVQLADGSTHFVQPPRLLSASTSFNTVNVWHASYDFTLDLPENAGEPLQRVTIALREGGDFPQFFLTESRAFAGRSSRRGQALNLQGVTQDRQSQSLTVVFDPPVTPGQTVTIRLYPIRNPRFGGVYLFGVTAFPPGEQARGQFLGYGRLHFYEGDRFWY